MYEFEDIKSDSRDTIYPVNTTFLRWSNYLSLTYTLKNEATTFFSLVAYIQPAIYDMTNSYAFNVTENYRFLLNASVRTSITKRLAIGMTFKYRNASVIQSFLENFDSSFRGNLTINF